MVSDRIPKEVSKRASGKRWEGPGKLSGTEGEASGILASKQQARVKASDSKAPDAHALVWGMSPESDGCQKGDLIFILRKRSGASVILFVFS